MAKTKFNYPIESIEGSINKTTFRKKHFKDEDGKVLGEGAQEAYIITNPRDWKKNPPKGAELRKIELWKQTCAQTKMIIRNPEDIKDDPTLTDETKAQALTTLALWKKRFDAQRIKGEADAPINPQNGKRKTYQRFDCFVRAAILHELQKGK